MAHEPIQGETAEQRLTVFVCGIRLCRDGKEHGFNAWHKTADGGTLVCSKCGLSAMALDLLRLP